MRLGVLLSQGDKRQPQRLVKELGEDKDLLHEALHGVIINKEHQIHRFDMQGQTMKQEGTAQDIRLSSSTSTS